MFSLLIFFLILSILVLVHEFGHFFVAKKNGVKVEEFGLGLPPKLFGKKIGETEYTFNLLPFGGFVRILGEDSEDGTSTDPDNFTSKTPLQRFAILVAGVVMNLILGVFLYYIVLGSNGFKSQNIPLIFDYDFRFGNVQKISTLVTGFSENSPAQNAGIEVGEAVLTIDGNPVADVLDVREVLKEKSGQEVSVLVRDLRSREGSERVVKLIPATDADGGGILGTFLTSSVVLDYSQGADTALAGFMHAYNVTAYSMSTFKDLISLSFETKDVSVVSSGVSGPVGIYSVVDGILEFAGTDAFFTILDFMALMSISLAIMNILPFPALDGGRIVFVLYEAVTKKKVDPKREVSIHRWGMMVLLGFIALVTIKDIIQNFFYS